MSIDYSKLAKRHLEDALSLGYLTLENGETRELKASEILAVSRYVVKEGWVTGEEAETSNSPSEMFTLDLEKEEMKITETDSKEWKTLYGRSSSQTI